MVIQNENDAQRKKILRILNWFFPVMITVFTLIGILGYLSVRGNPDLERLTYLPLLKHKSVLLIFAQTCMLFTCVVSHFFNFKPTRDLLEKILI